MATFPIALIGNNLSQRHKYLSALVNKAYQRGDNFQTIENSPEATPVDRLFKIDLASKLKKTEYILKTLKDDDMLYVSRALQSLWLCGPNYEDIVNPSYLEEKLYPEMLTTAVNKMQHWIHLNLNDPKRCEQFYHYYQGSNLDLAMKFIWKCSNTFIIETLPSILIDITPEDFKKICEICPQAAKIYYDSIEHNEELRTQYTQNQKQYFNSLKSVLKADGDIYLDIAEKYYNQHVFNQLSPIATKFVMQKYKNRFWAKAELYTSWFFGTKALAECLTAEESKELILRVARAGYLDWWFSYKTVEPLMKRLKPEERGAFKTKVFVNKDVGEVVKDWPYPTPSPPTINYHETKETIFDEDGDAKFKRSIKRRAYKHQSNWAGRQEDFIGMSAPFCGMMKRKTPLDLLYDEFRFANFEKTMFELRSRIKTASSSQMREYMLLVLVSKSGGREDKLVSLLELLSKHANEPSHVRAAVVRSLTKRACIWRLSEDSWDHLLVFARGLGLDGKEPEADCSEGLHAVVIRSLLKTNDCGPDIKKAFMNNFSTLTDYKFTPEERKIIAETLPKLALEAAELENDVDLAVDWINTTVNTLNEYKVNVETYPGLIETIASFAKNDLYSTRCLLENCYKAKIARQRLFKEYFEVIQTSASYMNALRHDSSVLSTEKFLKLEKVPHSFLRKLAIYFSERDGLSKQFLFALKSTKPAKRLARPLAFLLAEELPCYLREIDGKIQDKDYIELSHAIRANEKVSRPLLDIETFGWQDAGVKVIANRVVVCRRVEVELYVKRTLEWKSTSKLAIALSHRNNTQSEVFKAVGPLFPVHTISAGLKYLRARGDSADLGIWDAVKPLIITKHIKCVSMQNKVQNIDKIPSAIFPEYCVVVYTAIKGLPDFVPLKMVRTIESKLRTLERSSNEEFVKDFLVNDFLPTFTPEKIDVRGDGNMKKMCVIASRILLKHVLLSQSEENFASRVESLLVPFLKRVEAFWKVDKKFFDEYFKQMLVGLKYAKAFTDLECRFCVKTLERIVSWMQDVVPREQYFKQYVFIHLSMLYCKAMQQSLQQLPETFADPTKKLIEGVRIIGETFGKYIAHEVTELRSRYFASILDLYADATVSYVSDFFGNADTGLLLAGIVKGILQTGKGSECRIALTLMLAHRYDIDKTIYKELTNNVRAVESEEFKFFAYAEDIAV